MAITENIEVRTIRPIVDSFSGTVLAPEGEVGKILDYAITPGAGSYIPLNRLFDPQLKRRLVFTVDLPQGIYQLTFPEQLEFITEWGLLKALLCNKTVQQVEPTSPTPQFRSVVARPLAVTLVLDDGLRVTLIVDKNSGMLDVELEA